MINRRSLITGLISFAAAPAIVRASSLMPVKQMLLEFSAWPAPNLIGYYLRIFNESNRTIYLRVPTLFVEGEFE